MDRLALQVQGHLSRAYGLRTSSWRWREVEITERHGGKEFAHSMRRLAEEIYPRAGRIRVVCVNLSTHTAAAFYETFAPEIAHQLAWKIEFVYTPVHRSCLNMVE